MCTLPENKKCEETLPNFRKRWKLPRGKRNNGVGGRVHSAQLSSNLPLPRGSPLVRHILIYSRNKGKGLAPLHRGFRKEPTGRGVLSSSSRLSQLSMA